MNILFVGDVVGKPGRKLLRQNLAELKTRHNADFTVVNVENAAGGFGLTPQLGAEILAMGADVMTSGNHIWDKREVEGYLDLEPRLLRPGNYPDSAAGRSWFVGEDSRGVAVAVLNLQGRVFMPPIDCPFQTVEAILPRLAERTPIILIDFHAEATSEKMAFGWFVDGRVSAVVGTHTHVPTADCRVLPKGTGYVSDVGMTGGYDSVIGMEPEGSLKRFLTGRPSRFAVAVKRPRLSAVWIDVDDSEGFARSVERVDIGNFND